MGIVQHRTFTKHCIIITVWLVRPSSSHDTVLCTCVFTSAVPLLQHTKPYPVLCSIRSTLVFCVAGERAGTHWGGVYLLVRCSSVRSSPGGVWTKLPACSHPFNKHQTSSVLWGEYLAWLCTVHVKIAYELIGIENFVTLRA